VLDVGEDKGGGCRGPVLSYLDGVCARDAIWNTSIFAFSWCWCFIWAVACCAPADLDSMFIHCCNFDAGLLGAENIAVYLVGMFIFFDVEARRVVEC